MSHDDIVSVCEDIGMGKGINGKIAKEQTISYLERITKREAEVDEEILNIIASSYYIGVLETIDKFTKGGLNPNLPIRRSNFALPSLGSV